jgi:hypothetical protein
VTAGCASRRSLGLRVFVIFVIFVVRLYVLSAGFAGFAFNVDAIAA